MEADAGKTLELVVFKLAEGVPRERFLETVDGVSAWAREQPGFISRDLSYDAEGDRWVEVVWWRTMDDAHAAAERAMQSEACAPMFGLIEEESTLMIYADLAIEPVHAATAAARA
jgi:hypothetical protein